MKRFTFDQLVNDKTRKKTRKLQLTTANVSKKDRAISYSRDPEETILLAKSLRRHLQRARDERILVKNGRHWRLYL